MLAIHQPMWGFFAFLTPILCSFCVLFLVSGSGVMLVNFANGRNETKSGKRLLQHMYKTMVKGALGDLKKNYY